MPQCLIPNCTNNANNNISVRLRRQDTTAIWAPNTEAYLCDSHASDGYIVNINFIPAQTKTITTNVSSGNRIETRSTPITNQP